MSLHPALAAWLKGRGAVLLGGRAVYPHELCPMRAVPNLKPGVPIAARGGQVSEAMQRRLVTRRRNAAKRDGAAFGIPPEAEEYMRIWAQSRGWSNGLANPVTELKLGSGMAVGDGKTPVEVSIVAGYVESTPGFDFAQVALRKVYISRDAEPIHERRAYVFWWLLTLRISEVSLRDWSGTDSAKVNVQGVEDLHKPAGNDREQQTLLNGLKAATLRREAAVRKLAGVSSEDKAYERVRAGAARAVGDEARIRARLEQLQGMAKQGGFERGRGQLPKTTPSPEFDPRGFYFWMVWWLIRGYLGVESCDWERKNRECA